MIKLKYGKYVNGNEQITEEKIFNPISVLVKNVVEQNDFRDVTGRFIKNVLYTNNVYEIIIGTDEYYSNIGFLKNFWSATLQKIVIGNEEKYCRTTEKGALPVSETGLRKEVKLIIEVY